MPQCRPRCCCCRPHPPPSAHCRVRGQHGGVLLGRHRAQKALAGAAPRRGRPRRQAQHRAVLHRASLLAEGDEVHWAAEAACPDARQACALRPAPRLSAMNRACRRRATPLTCTRPPQFCCYFDVEPRYVDVREGCLGEPASPASWAALARSPVRGGRLAHRGAAAPGSRLGLPNAGHRVRARLLLLVTLLAVLDPERMAELIDESTIGGILLHCCTVLLASARVPPPCRWPGARPACIRSRLPAGRPSKTSALLRCHRSGVVLMMGSTYTGQFEPVEAADAALERVWQARPPACVWRARGQGQRRQGRPGWLRAAIHAHRPPGCPPPCRSAAGRCQSTWTPPTQAWWRRSASRTSPLTSACTT